MSKGAAQRLLFVGILVGACLSVGIILIISAVVPGGIHANPYIALSVFLGSFALLATALTAIKEQAKARRKQSPTS